ncbi:hypothetical protein B0H17DRAFT_1152621 [Mycena rosella]|uniref:Uncharacterized protein n=1 Tax=Mycena rosella TaxID=1033263 RepID=A0AAD7FD20_MYCRO|nr:hypothetical protein B0H17DRAFT_1152621 [Mycena rosella]
MSAKSGCNAAIYEAKWRVPTRSPPVSRGACWVPGAHNQTVPTAQEVSFVGAPRATRFRTIPWDTPHLRYRLIHRYRLVTMLGGPAARFIYIPTPLSSDGPDCSVADSGLSGVKYNYLDLLLKQSQQLSLLNEYNHVVTSDLAAPVFKNIPVIGDPGQSAHHPGPLGHPLIIVQPNEALSSSRCGRRFGAAAGLVVFGRRFEGQPHHSIGSFFSIFPSTHNTSTRDHPSVAGIFVALNEITRTYKSDAAACPK